MSDTGACFFFFLERDKDLRYATPKQTWFRWLGYIFKAGEKGDALVNNGVFVFSKNIIPLCLHQSGRDGGRSENRLSSKEMYVL